MRTARVGFILLAVVVALEVALGIVMRILWSSSGDHLDLTQLLLWFYLGLAALSAAATFAVARVPARTGARGPALAAGIVAGIDVLLELGWRVVGSHASSVETMELVAKGFQAINGLASLAISALLAVVVLRVGRAAGARWSPVAAIGLLTFAALSGTLTGVQLIARTPSLYGVGTILYYAHSALLLLVWPAMAVVVGRVEDDPPAPAGDRGAVDPGWRRVAAGITVYLVAGAARIAFAILGFFVMRGADGASSYGELHTVRDDLLTVALFSGVAGLGMLAGVITIARGPRPASPASTTAVLMVIGMILDGVTAKITYDAFDSVSGAFFAQDALPVLAALATGLGVGAGAALLTAFADSAAALESAALAERARATRTLLVTAGALGAGAQLLVAKVASPILVPIALLLVPAMLYAAFRFLTVALGLRREIRCRS